MSFFITTAISYVNAEPHMGHAYEAITTDVIARHMRQRGEDVFFLTGTDEHGEPVADAAAAQGLDPKVLADRNAERFKALLPILNVSNDFFVRTTDPQHEARVQEILQAVHDAGHTYKGLYEGWYCPRCADFKVENEILEGNLCPIHEIPLERHQEENWFFRLSSFQQPLERLYREQPDFVLPRARFNEARAFIAQGLADISLSRARLRWGIPVTWDPSQVFYVWFDALLNYVTALSYARDGEDLTSHYWPANVHVIGKDILKFHTIFWPAILMAAGLEVPRHVLIHGFLLMDDKKMSKSLGNVLNPFEVLAAFGADALRYYCVRQVSFGQDGNVSAKGFEERYENELANEYGNLASRTLAMIGRYREGVVPQAAIDPLVAADFDALPEQVSDLVDRFELTPALDVIWQRVRRLNRYVEERAPWQLARDPARAAELDETLASLAEGLRVVSVLLHPYMPSATERLLNALGTPGTNYADASLSEQGSGQRVEALEPLFPKAGLIDSHTHLDMCEPPTAELVDAASAAGVTRIVTVGTTSESCRAALAAAEEFEPVYAAIGRHPNEAAGFDDAVLEELRALAQHEKCVAIGETGLDYYRDYAPREDQERAFASQIGLAAELDKPVVIHTRAAEDDTLRTLNELASEARVILHCFTMAARVQDCLEHEGWWFSFAGNATYPKSTDLREAARLVPAAGLLVETDAPFLAPQAVRGKPNQPAYVAHTARAVAEERGMAYSEFEAATERSAAAVFGWSSDRA